MAGLVRFHVREPYDLTLSLGMSDRFCPVPSVASGTFRTAIRAEGVPATMQVSQVGANPSVLEVTGSPEAIVGSLEPIARWMLFGELDLRPFYEAVEGHDVLGKVVQRLRGLKPTRPPSLFEMAVTAVTEQQISMAAAYRIRSRVVETFGDLAHPPGQPGKMETAYAFPTPESIASAPMEKLEACGLSRRKAEYVRGLARAIVAGALDLERLKELPSEDVRAVITELRGFGPWSADYILVRGLGRVDCAPVGDLGVRTVVGSHLGDGSRMTSDAVREALAPFKPYRGLVAFYLLADSRDERDKEHRAGT